MKLKLIRLANVFNPSFHRSFIILFAVMAVGAVCSKLRSDFVLPGILLLVIYTFVFPIFNYPKYIEFCNDSICYVFSPSQVFNK